MIQFNNKPPKKLVVKNLKSKYCLFIWIYIINANYLPRQTEDIGGVRSHSSVKDFQYNRFSFPR